MPLVVGTDTKIELSFPSPAAGIIWAVCLDSKCQDDIVVIVLTVHNKLIQTARKHLSSC